jgi:hypothetical protein
MEDEAKYQTNHTGDPNDDLAYCNKEYSRGQDLSAAYAELMYKLREIVKELKDGKTFTSWAILDRLENLINGG